MISRLLHGLAFVNTWHRLMLQGSPGYRRLCHALAGYLTTGYWDLRPQPEDPGY